MNYPPSCGKWSETVDQIILFAMTTEIITINIKYMHYVCNCNRSARAYGWRIMFLASLSPGFGHGRTSWKLFHRQNTTPCRLKIYSPPIYHGPSSILTFKSRSNLNIWCILVRPNGGFYYVPPSVAVKKKKKWK